ncbi:MAG: D-alanyl-D-alanine carboxypeptidase [Bacilli bacterium]|nr:D-alanyl-D-alanine carboxypeptidase [Bacilli bacterium]MDD4547178.1 D-alanyl-D-alanine carboxypeptidase [Bacilli bacterium]
MKKMLVIILLIFIMPISANAFSTSAECGILMDQNSKRIMYEKNIHKVKSVASISKIMTAVVAIESNKLNEIVVIDDEILKAYGSAIYIKIGEKISLLDLVYGLMLRSGNDAALAIATSVSGSVEQFVAEMNKKAKEIGMKNTVFNNPSGLDNEKGNYSTVYDMALLTSYAMSNDTFKKITGTKRHVIKTNMNVYDWTNKNKLLSLYKYATGGKTGFTEIAKRTLVTTASKDNLDLVAVTFNDGNDFYDHQSLFEEGFETYKNYKILLKDKINIIGENYYRRPLYLKNSFTYPLLSSEVDNLYLKFEISKVKNYKVNDIVGLVKVMVGDQEIYKDNIYVGEKVKKERKGIFEWFKSLW